MSIGLCCQYMEKITKRNGTEEYINICNEKNLQLGQFKSGHYSSKQIEETWIHNITNLTSVVKRVSSEGVKVMRFSSGLLPLADLVPDLLNSSTTTKLLLNELGNFVKSQNMRVNFHPDQFVVLSSNRQDVINNSMQILSRHAWIFDQMGLDHSPFYAINVHGGTKGNSTVLINSIKNLQSNIKSRLTLENDERSYNTKELYSVFEETGIPIVWDSHHHSFNTSNLTEEEALDLCIKSWQSVKPLTHLSNTEPELIKGNFTERRKHSQYVHYIPDVQFKANNENKIDIDFEFKMKNLAIFKAVKEFNIKL